MPQFKLSFQCCQQFNKPALLTTKQPVLEICPVTEKQLRLTQERALVSRPSGQRGLQMVETTAGIRLIILCH